MATIKGAINLDELESLKPLVYDPDYRDYAFNDNVNYKQYGLVFEDVITITEKGVSNPFKFDLGGYGLTYALSSNNDPIITGGTLTGFKVSASAKSKWIDILAVGGFSVSATQFYDAAMSEGNADDIAFFQEMLSGDDNFDLSNLPEVVRAYAGNDKIFAKGGADNLDGGSGLDWIDGGIGDDNICGGLGKDTLKGSTGADVFIYKTIQDSGIGPGNRDVITDFKSSQKDLIDISAIDADPSRDGDQAFTYIGAQAFTGSKAEVRFTAGLLELNTGGDTLADMEIALTACKTFKDSYLVL